MKSSPNKFDNKVKSISLGHFIYKQELIILLPILSIFSILAVILWNLTIERKLTFWQTYSKFDIILLERIHNSIPPVIGFFLEKVYVLTGAHVTAFVVAGALGFLLWKRWWKEAIILGVFTMSILLMNDLVFKPFFFRLRPPEWLVHVTGRSFPSGHATGNFFFYFYLAYILSYWFPKRGKYWYGIATGILLLIGLSSTYVRVHWVSDILAGYGLGYLWLVISLVILRGFEPKYRQFKVILR